MRGTFPNFAGAFLHHRCYHCSDAGCVTVCPVAALTEEGFDRHKCYARLLQNAREFEREGLGDVCGKCVSVVPCSFQDPVARLLKSK